MMAKPRRAGLISPGFAKRIADTVRRSESDARKKSSALPARIPRSHGIIAIEWVKLDDDLLRNDIAPGTLLEQADDPDGDGTGGGWTARTDDAADVIVYAKHLTGTINLIPDGFKLASGCVVACSRNPQSGLLNLLQSTCCPVTV